MSNKQIKNILQKMVNAMGTMGLSNGLENTYWYDTVSTILLQDLPFASWAWV